LKKAETSVLSAIPWITNSTTIQNIVIIAIVSNITTQIQLQSLKPYRYTAENNVAMSLHLHYVPQADMLECRFEILLIVSHPKNLHIRICSPNKRGQYNNVLENDTYLVAVVIELCYMIFGWWIS
jgi:hypothetical protein